VRAALAGNAACSPAALRTLAKRCWREPEVLRALAGNTAAPPLLLRHLAGHRWDVACIVAANPSCPGRLLRSGRLCGSQVLAVRMAVAAGAAGPPSIFARLARDNAAVRLFLATNPALSPEVVDSLLADPDRYVGRVAAAHLRASPEALVRLADGMTAPAWTLRAIAANPACPPDLSDQLLTWLALGGPGASDPRFDPAPCSGHPGDPGANLAVWYRDEAANATDPLRHPLWRVRAAIPASRKSTPYIWLAEMARDIRPEVRQVASRYSGLPAVVLKELSDDAAAVVAKQATASLKRKAEQPETKVLRRRVWTTRVVMGAILVAVLAFEFRPGQGPSFPSTPTITFPNDVPSPIFTAGAPVALPGGGTLVAGLLAYSGGTYLTVVAQGERLTVTIPGTAGSVPAAQSGYPVAAYSAQQFVFATAATAARTISVTVTAADGKHATIPVQLPAQG